MSTYTDEIFENQRRGMRGWTGQLLMTDREPWSDRAGDPVKRAEQDKHLSMHLPRGWKWISEWIIDISYTQCDAEGWSYGRSFGSIDTKANEQQSRSSPLAVDTCRRRRWIRTRQRTSEKGLHDEEDLNSPNHKAAAALPPERNSGGAYGKETQCSICHSKFHLLRRRHHCRKCYSAVCKECSQKVAIRNNGRPQLYCSPCLSEDENPIKRRTLSRQASVPDPLEDAVTKPSQDPKFCIECGYELPCNVKFCIECGTSVAASSLVAISSPSPVKSSPLAAPPTSTSDHLENEKLSPSSNKADYKVEDTTEKTAESLLSQPNSRAEEEPKDQSHETESSSSASLLPSGAVPSLPAPMVKAVPLDYDDLKMQNQKLRDEVAQLESALQKLKYEKSTTGVPAKDHPKYMKFFKLAAMEMPAEQIKEKMKNEGLDPQMLDSPNHVIENETGGNDNAARSTQQTVKDSPDYQKFFKLLKMGLPAEQVKMKISVAGLDPNLLDTPDALIQTPGEADSPEKTITVQEDPEYEKYFKLLKMGLPAEQVKIKMKNAGVDPELLDDPTKLSPNAGKMASLKNEPSGISSQLPPPMAAVAASPVAQTSTKKKQEQAPPKPEVTLPKKPVIKPKVEMRALFWTRVPTNVVTQTVWNSLTDEKVSLNKNEMEWMFRKKTGEKKGEDHGAKFGRKASAKELPQKVHLLDPKRQQNVGIAIARFRMPVSEIKTAIWELDTSKISGEKLNSLISIAPTVEEQDMLKNYDGDVKKLGNVEKFFIEMLTIPRFTQRIKCFRFKMQFENRIIETQAQMDILTAATNQVADSTKFNRVLETVLAIGNYMNGDTPRGGAYGYKLDALNKLHTIKSIDQRINLMHYLAHHIEENAEYLMNFPGEFPHIGEATRLSLSQLKADISSNRSELRMLEGQIRASEKSAQDYPDDQFVQVMSPFAKEASEIMLELDRDFGHLETSYQELVTSFGEDSRKLKAADFFSILSNFVNEFKKAWRDNHSPPYQRLWELNRTAQEEAEDELKDDEHHLRHHHPSSTTKSHGAQASLPSSSKKSLGSSSPPPVALKSSSSSSSPVTTHVTGDEAKALYTQVIATISKKSIELGGELASTGVDQFKVMSRKFGASDISADAFCKYVGKTFGTRLMIAIIPEVVRLLPDVTKRQLLLEAHDRVVATLRRDREEKRQKREQEAADQAGEAAAREEAIRAAEGQARARAQTKARLAVERIEQCVVSKFDEIQPVVGEEAQELHKSILDSVRQAFDQDAVRVKEFSVNARRFGNEQMSAKDFYHYLTTSFDSDFVARLVPELARLLQDGEKRHALLQALCESAPGWARFAGL